MVTDLVAQTRLIPILHAYSQPGPGIYAVHARGRHRNANIRAVIDALLSTFSRGLSARPTAQATWVAAAVAVFLDSTWPRRRLQGLPARPGVAHVRAFRFAPPSNCPRSPSVFSSRRLRS